MKAELLKLIERYENKIKSLEHADDESYSYHKGIILGLEIAMNDLMDLLNDIELV